jgi:hypothetical protein
MEGERTLIDVRHAEELGATRSGSTPATLPIVQSAEIEIIMSRNAGLLAIIEFGQDCSIGDWKGGMMPNEPTEHLEDEMFRLFESLRERGLTRAAVGLVLDLLNLLVVHEKLKSGGVIPKDVESRERSVAAHRRTVRSIVSFLLLRAEEKPELNPDATFRTRAGAYQIAAEAAEAAELLDDIGRQCALYFDECLAQGSPPADTPILLHVLRDAIGNDDVLRQHIDF